MKSADWIFVLLGAILLGDQKADAIYRDDVGVLDFSVATAGHGAFGWASHSGDILLTTDVPTASSPNTSCYVAGRRTSDGSLEWRKNVCSVQDEEKQAHGVAVSNTNDAFYTVDNSGVARAWTVDKGDLLWDAKVTGDTTSAPPRLFFVAGSGDQSYVAVSAGSSIVLLDANTGEIVDTIATPSQKDGKHVEWLSVLSVAASSTIQLAFARVNSSDGTIASGDDFLVGTYKIGTTFKASAGIVNAKGIVADSVRTLFGNNNPKDFHVWAVTTTGSVVHSAKGKTKVLPASDWNESWGAVVGIEASADPSVVRLSGKSDPSEDSAMEVFRYDGSSWNRILKNKSGDKNSAVAYAPKFGVVVTTPVDRSVEVYSTESGKALEIVGDIFGADGDSVTVVSVLDESESVTVLVGTERGSTTLFSLTKGSNNAVDLKVKWTAEEGLASLTSAIILDASHLGSDDLVEEKDELAYRLSMAGRLKAQWQEFGAMLSTANGLIGSGDNFNYRDHLFGFLKVSALLSSKSHRMWGMSTSGGDRGSIRWSLDLPKTALWHSMVHGTTNAAKAAHGIHGDTHSREILVLSASAGRVDWMCIDGTSGAINAQDSIPVASPIKQVVPMYGTSTGGCRQASLLLGDDLSLTVVPSDAQTDALVQKQLQKTPNGLYTHNVDTVANKVESYRVSHDQGFVARPVGLTSFAGEQIVKVAYPMRHEDMQSMSTILGDNSLLLKYINPHLAVVITMLSDADEQSVTEVATALEKEQIATPRKPLGAGAPGSSTTSQQQPPQGATDIPNMFVNLVDTVSGHILYRHGHSNVDAAKKVSVVISENWVVYSYIGATTRRTEIGVLTLHEGMIEPKGLTYFANPDQSSSFSSFDARNSKPVVLSKVYAFPKAITALGVTSTRQGIGRQNILMASADGALTTINKMILETRRPVGDAKAEEKKEGLLPYREMIPQSPMFSLNYNQTMEPFTSIVSSTTALESQSLVFGFGGPDLFFTRTSPTKGFDLLPETFNKMLVGASTAGIVLALFIVQRMGKKKALKHDWL